MHGFGRAPQPKSGQNPKIGPSGKLCLKLDTAPICTRAPGRPLSGRVKGSYCATRASGGTARDLVRPHPRPRAGNTPSRASIRPDHAKHEIMPQTRHGANMPPRARPTGAAKPSGCACEPCGWGAFSGVRTERFAWSGLVSMVSNAPGHQRRISSRTVSQMTYAESVMRARVMTPPAVVGAPLSPSSSPIWPSISSAQAESGSFSQSCSAASTCGHVHRGVR